MLHINKDLFQWDALQSRPQEIDAMVLISLDAPSAYKLGHRQSRVGRSERVAGEQLQRCTCILSVDTPLEHDSVVGMSWCRREWGVEFDGGRRISKGRDRMRERIFMARKKYGYEQGIFEMNEEQKINDREKQKYLVKCKQFKNVKRNFQKITKLSTNF